MALSRVSTSHFVYTTCNILSKPTRYEKELSISWGGGGTHQWEFTSMKGQILKFSKPKFKLVWLMCQLNQTRGKIL